MIRKLIFLLLFLLRALNTTGGTRADVECNNCISVIAGGVSVAYWASFRVFKLFKTVGTILRVSFKVGNKRTGIYMKIAFGCWKHVADRVLGHACLLIFAVKVLRLLEGKFETLAKKFGIMLAVLVMQYLII